METRAKTDIEDFFSEYEFVYVLFFVFFNKQKNKFVLGKKISMPVFAGVSICFSSPDLSGLFFCFFGVTVFLMFKPLVVRYIFFHKFKRLNESKPSKLPGPNKAFKQTFKKNKV